MLWDYEALGVVEIDFLHYTLRELGVEKVGLTSGPISTGGEGSLPANMRVFKETIAGLERLRVPLFNQLPFESHMWRIAQRLGDRFDAKALMDGFYLPLFESRRIGTLYFIHGWESSSGASQEHVWTLEREIPRYYLPKNFHMMFREERSREADGKPHCY